MADRRTQEQGTAPPDRRDKRQAGQPADRRASQAQDKDRAEGQKDEAATDALVDDRFQATDN